MMATKRCTKCKESKKIEEYPIDTRHTDGRKSQCKKCVTAHSQKKYMERHIPKMPPILLSWQPKPGDRFKAYLLVDLGNTLEKVQCELNPFVCEENRNQEVVATSLDSRWKLDKSAYIFGRTN